MDLECETTSYLFLHLFLYSALYPVNINKCIDFHRQIIILMDFSFSQKKTESQFIVLLRFQDTIASICLQLCLIPSFFPCLSRQKTSYIFFCCSGLGPFLFLSVAVQTLNTACRGELIAVAATSVCCQLSVPLLLCKAISPFVSEYSRKIVV